MAPVKLRNGLVLDEAKIARPKVNRSPTLTITPRLGRKPTINFSSAIEDPHSRAVRTPGIVVNGLAKASSFTTQQLNENAARFMQTALVRSFEITFAGSKNSDGLVVFAFGPNALNRVHLDCLVDRNGKPVNHPFYNNEFPGFAGPKTYAPGLNDSPGFVHHSDTRNGRTGKWNYFFTFRCLVDFQTHLVFVHKDQSREALLTWRWSLDRFLKFRWRSGQPRIFNQMGRFRVDNRASQPTFNERHLVEKNTNAMEVLNTLTGKAFRLTKAGVNEFASRKEFANYQQRMNDPFFWG